MIDAYDRQLLKCGLNELYLEVYNFLITFVFIFLLSHYMDLPQEALCGSEELLGIGIYFTLRTRTWILKM